MHYSEAPNLQVMNQQPEPVSIKKNTTSIFEDPRFTSKAGSPVNPVESNTSATDVDNRFTSVEDHRFTENADNRFGSVENKPFGEKTDNRFISAEDNRFAGNTNSQFNTTDSSQAPKQTDNRLNSLKDDRFSENTDTRFHSIKKEPSENKACLPESADNRDLSGKTDLSEDEVKQIVKAVLQRLTKQ